MENKVKKIDEKQSIVPKKIDVILNELRDANAGSFRHEKYYFIGQKNEIWSYDLKEKNGKLYRTRYTMDKAEELPVDLKDILEIKFTADYSGEEHLKKRLILKSPSTLKKDTYINVPRFKMDHNYEESEKTELKQKQIIKRIGKKYGKTIENAELVYGSNTKQCKKITVDQPMHLTCDDGLSVPINMIQELHLNNLKKRIIFIDK